MAQNVKSLQLVTPSLLWETGLLKKIEQFGDKKPKLLSRISKSYQFAVVTHAATFLFIDYNEWPRI